MRESLNKKIQFRDALDLIKERLEKDGQVVLTPGGGSMKPMLSDGGDQVVLSKPAGKLKKYDIPLYIRKNSGQFVMHRVIGFDKNGGYILSGDNQIEKEYGITDQDVIGVVTSFYRSGKRHSTEETLYRFYCRLHTWTRPLRRVYRAAKRRLCKR